MSAFSELVADRGLGARLRHRRRRARGRLTRGVLRLLDGLADCADAAYERFISVLLTRLADAMDPTDHWHAFVESAVRAYLEALQADPVVARAMQLEMDAAGTPARLRRRLALKQIADVISARHSELREEDPSTRWGRSRTKPSFRDGLRRPSAGVRRPRRRAEPDLLALVRPTLQWIAATVRGAASVETGRPTDDSRPGPPRANVRAAARGSCARRLPTCPNRPQPGQAAAALRGRGHGRPGPRTRADRRLVVDRRQRRHASSSARRPSPSCGPGAIRGGCRAPADRWLGAAPRRLKRCRAGPSCSTGGAGPARMRAEGLEPPRLAPPAPKAGVSTSSTTPARRPERCTPARRECKVGPVMARADEHGDDL